MASQPNSDEKIKLLLLNLFDSYSESEKRTKTEGRSASVSITFTKSEVSKMAKTFKTEFIANGLAAHVLKRQNSKNSVIYEIRYRRGGYYIHVSAATLEKAKAAFLRETLPENIDKHRRKIMPRKTHSQLSPANGWNSKRTNFTYIITRTMKAIATAFFFPLSEMSLSRKSKPSISIKFYLSPVVDSMKIYVSFSIPFSNMPSPAALSLIIPCFRFLSKKLNGSIDGLYLPMSFTSLFNA